MLKSTHLLLSLLLLLIIGLPVLANDDLKDSPTAKFAKVDDIKVHYQSLGSGKTTLVFIHGWTCDQTFWRFQVPALEKQARLLLIDLPGHGHSDKPDIAYTMDLFARAVNAVLIDAKVDKAVLIGHSMGTPVIRQFYRLYPQKTQALVAVDGALKPFFTDQKQIDQFIANFNRPDYKDGVGKFVDSMFSPQASSEMRESTKKSMLSAPQYVVVNAMKAMLDPAIWKDDSIDVPLQVINAKSPVWTASYEAYVRQLNPKVDYHYMEGVGHFLMMEQPEQFNKLLIEFLHKQNLMGK